MKDKNQSEIERNREMFKAALIEAMSREYKRELGEAEEISSEVSDKHKREMNLFFRKKVKSDFVPYPEIEEKLQ